MKTKQKFVSSESRTLNIEHPFGNVFFMSIIYLLSGLVISELIIHSLIHFDVINTPTIGTNNPGFNIKLIMLDNIIKRDGGIDCIFLGSSMVYDSVDPEIFMEKYLSLTGKKVSCYNFGVDYLTAATAGEISRLLVQRYEPSLLIYGTSARDYSLGMGGNRDLVNDEWIQYKLGNWSVVGVIREYSMNYRLYLQFLTNLNPVTREYIVDVLKNTTVFGQDRIDSKMDTTVEWAVINEENLQQKDFTGLKRLIKLDKGEVKVVIVEIPVNNNYLNVYVNNSLDSYQALFVDPVKQIASERGIPFIHSVSDNSYNSSDDEWADVKHMNINGAANFSAWLAQEIWWLEQNGALSWAD